MFPLQGDCRKDASRKKIIIIIKTRILLDRLTPSSCAVLEVWEQRRPGIIPNQA